MSSPFTITTATPAIQLDASRHGVATFTVTNTTAHPIRGRADLSAETPGVEAWLAVEGPRERDFAEQGTEQYAVGVRVPTNAAPGRYAFGLSMVGVDDPDELFSEGPRVEFEVMQPVKPRRPFPWWIVAAVVGVLAIAAIVTSVLLTRKVEVPDVINQKAYDAQKTLEDAGLKVGKTTTAPDAAATPGYVIATTPGAGEKVERGSSVTLVLASVMYRLTVNILPEEAGDVVPPISGAGTYEQGERVNLAANGTECGEGVRERYVFKGWEGPVPDSDRDSNTISITMDSNKELTARFESQDCKYKLRIKISPADARLLGGSDMVGGAGSYSAGTWAAAEVTTGETRCDESYSYFYVFSGWTGVDSEDGGRAHVEMDRDREITAEYERHACPQYTLTIAVEPKLAGELVSPRPGVYTYHKGEEITLGARLEGCVKRIGLRFSRWIGAVPSSSRDGQSVVVVVMDRNKGVTAEYGPGTICWPFPTRAVEP